LAGELGSSVMNLTQCIIFIKHIDFSLLLLLLLVVVVHADSIISDTVTADKHVQFVMLSVS